MSLSSQERIRNQQGIAQMQPQYISTKSRQSLENYTEAQGKRRLSDPRTQESKANSSFSHEQPKSRLAGQGKGASAVSRSDATFSKTLKAERLERQGTRPQTHSPQGHQAGKSNSPTSKQKRTFKDGIVPKSLQSKEQWMLPDHNVQFCNKCFRKFTVFTRKHHCRLCERIFCSKCSREKQLRLEKQVRKTRICTKCEQIHMHFAQEVRNNKKIMLVKQDFVLDEENSFAQPSQNNTAVIAQRQAQETRRLMDSTQHNQHGTERQRSSGPGHNGSENADTDREKNGDGGDKEDQVDKGKSLAEKLKQIRQQEGLQAASLLLSKQSTIMASKVRAMQEEEQHESVLQRSRSMQRARSSIRTADGGAHIKSGIGRSALDVVEESDVDENESVDLDVVEDDPSCHLDDFLEQIRVKVIKEFNLDEKKWSSLLAEFVLKAIHTVKPSSFAFKDSIDITDYVKIQLVQFKDTSKSKYLNGVVIKKSIAHKRMNWEIDNPRILLLSKSLGILKDEEDFMDLESEIKQEDAFIHIVMKKIELVKPDLIFVQNDASLKAIETLLQRNITLVTNVKQSVMQRLGRLTQTINCPSTNLLNGDFGAGKCEKFRMESLVMKSLNRTVDVNTNIIQLDGCLPFLGCTILLSGQDMNELKLVKHALKKILRLSRQLILESEYYQFLDLSHVAAGTNEDDKEMEQDTSNSKTGRSTKSTPFLHDKHMERDFLIFKETTFSRRKINHNQYDGEEDEDPPGNKGESSAAANQTEKEVQGRIQVICQPPAMKRVHFYSEKDKQQDKTAPLTSAEGDISLICKLRGLCQSAVAKCKKCDQYPLYHLHHFYHRHGYVEMRMRFSKEAPQNPEANQVRMKQSGDKQMFVQAQCEQCKINIFPKTVITKQLQELSFYSFLEQFFYNNQNLRIQQHKLGAKTCPHAFHSCSKVIFLIDLLRIEFQYHPVDIYELDLICFKDLQGSLTQEKILGNFLLKRQELAAQMEDTFDFLLVASKELGSWLQLLAGLELPQAESFVVARRIIEDISSYLENFESNMLEYRSNARDCVQEYKADNEFQLNKIHKSITNRVSDYIFILKTVYSQVFDEFIGQMCYWYLLLRKEAGKISKSPSSKEQAQLLLQLHRDQQQARHSRRTVTPNASPFQGDRASSGAYMMDHQSVRSSAVDVVASSLRGQFADDKAGPQHSLPEVNVQLASASHEEALGLSAAVAHQAAAAKSSSTDSRLNGFSHSLEPAVPGGTLSRPTMPRVPGDPEGMTTDAVTALTEFEERLKKHPSIKQFMKMSPSIPNGFDMNCTNVDVDDFSTVICQTLLSNDHILGLKEQGYMNLESRMEKYQHRHVYKPPGFDKRNASKQHGLGNAGSVPPDFDINKLDGLDFDKPDAEDAPTELRAGGTTAQQAAKHTEEFYVIKEDQDVLNKEISQKEIETELLRLDQYHFQINFNTYKGPQSNEMTMTKDRISKALKVDRTVLQNVKTLSAFEKITPSDLDNLFYVELNSQILQQIHQLKALKAREQNKSRETENQCKEVTQAEKYLAHSLFYHKVDIGTKVYFPSHFQALRKLYCGSFNQQNEQMFKSSFWTDNTGGKSKSDFYKSYNEKYVLKVIGANEMRMFCEFAFSYFEYMCRSFNQKCPTSIGKILGAFKIKIRSSHDKKANSWHVILMENLTVGIDANKASLSKYDLKGSQSRRYVDTKGKAGVTKLDTNFLEDHNSRPVCMNYTMNRLMEIAIHNDTSFLSRHEKIDYSFLVWIDHETKLIRVGIIDYIQYFSLEKFLESKIKRHLLNAGKAPTILNPGQYKLRFQEAMKSYFMSILTDQPNESFSAIVKRQLKLKEESAAAELERRLRKEEEQAQLKEAATARHTESNDILKEEGQNASLGVIQPRGGHQGSEQVLPGSQNRRSNQFGGGAEDAAPATDQASHIQITQRDSNRSLGTTASKPNANEGPPTLSTISATTAHAAHSPSPPAPNPADLSSVSRQGHSSNKPRQED